MVGELAPARIEEVLAQNIIGRIGCHAFGRTYVVPITYAYDGGAVYVHGAEGMKLHMMRENPHVCFEVDCMDGSANWESVIASGTFEELHGDRAKKARELLISRIEPHVAQPPGASVHPKADMANGVLFRITLADKTGRFERRL